MKVGKGLLDVVNRAQALLDRNSLGLERLDVAPTEVQNVLQERRYRDTFSNGKSSVDNFLASNDFKQKYAEAMSGTSYRAGEAKKVEKKFEAIFNKDSFEPFKRAPVSLNGAGLKASDLQRVRIAA